jgi:methionine-rich copper-binding protein CopC
MRFIPHLSHVNLRVFNACLLAYLILIMPIVPLAASANRESSANRNQAKDGKPKRQLTATEKLEKALFVNPLVNPVVNPPAPPGPIIGASMTDSFIDNNSSSKADPGSTVTYTANISNTGSSDATGVQFTSTPDPNTTFVNGSIKVSPVALADSYTATMNTVLNVPALSGVLFNDTGTPSPTVGGVVGCADVTAPYTNCNTSLVGGKVTINADGSFLYTPPTNSIATDTFTYTATNVQAPNMTAVVTLNFDAAPTVSSTTPANGAISQAVNSNITVNFSEAVNATTSSFTIECPNPGNLQTFAVSGSGTSTITLDPTVDLPVGTLCTVTVIANQISDTDAIDPPDNMAANYLFSFTTETAPTVTTTVPANGATGVAVNSNITVNFSENVNVTGSTFTLECPSGTAKTFTLSPVAPGGTNSFTLNPTANLPAGVTCTVTVVANQVSDTDSVDPPDNMAADYVFTFATDAAPSVTTTTPTSGATSVAADTTIVVNFSENVNIADATAFKLECPAATPIAFGLTPAAPGATNQFTLDPTSDLPVGVVCTVTVVASKVTDTDADDPPDNMAANYVFTFTVDSPPTVSSTVPIDAATGVASDANITINFDESVNATTSSFTIKCPSSGASLPFTLSASPASSFTLNPNADLPDGVICQVTVIANQITDTDSGDPPDNMTSDFVFNFTTDAAPTVTNTAPANGAANVATNTNILVSFSEPVTATTSSFTVDCPMPGNLKAFTVGGSGTSVITLDPTVDLPAGTVCTVTVIAAQIHDTDSNDPPDTMAANYVFSFATEAAPFVTTTVPADAATDVAADSNITINFSENVNVTASTFTLECPVGTPQTFTLTPAAPGGTNSFTLDPTVDFPAGVICTVTVVANQVSDTDSVDPPDNMAADYAFTFTTDAAPSVTTTTPTNAAPNVATNTNIVVNFSEDVNITDATAFKLECPVGTPKGFGLTPAAPGATNQFTLDPTSDLPEGVVCTVTVVASKVTDTDANDPPDNMAADYVFTFTIDSPPSVSTTTPTNGATNGAANANIVVNFSEPVAATTSSFTIECPVGTPQTFTVSGSGTSAITLDPTTDLPSGVTCTVTVLANQISDSDTGDPPDNMTADYVFSFGTDAAPSVTTTTPTNGGANVATDTNIVIDFSETVTASTSSFTVNCPAPGNAQAFAVTGSGTSQITLNPTVDLPAGTLCTVTVLGAQIHDVDTNDPPDTMAANYVFSFTTDEPPSVSSTTPVNGATGAGTSTNIVVNFSEAVDATTSSFTIECPVGTPKTFTVSGTGTSAITLDPTADLPVGTTCTVTVIALQISDTDTGDPPDHMTANYVFTFTTDVPPSVTAISPVNGATQQANNTNITITFSEGVTVSATDWFQIVCGSSGTRNPGDTAVTGGPTIWTINPNTDFTNGESCTVTVFANKVNDTDANDPPDNMAANFGSSFTIDNPPSVSSTVPINGATGVAASTNITINFSEAVTASGSSFTIECPTPGNAQAFAVSGSGTSTITLNPTADLPAGTVCTVTVIANQISDTDSGDPPDNMTADHVFSFSVPPVAVNDTYNPVIIGNVGVNTDNSTEFTILANDTPNSGVTINQSGSSLQGGNVSVAADGKFSYMPPAGYEGADSFTYTISNASGTSNTATVSLTVGGMIWFINAAGGAGSGRLDNPMNAVSSFQAINNGTGNNPAAGDNIFIYQNASSYTGPITLLSNQKLIGQDATASLATIAGVTPPPDSFPLPAMDLNAPATTLDRSSAASNAVNLCAASCGASTNTIRGLTITTGSSTSKGISGSSFGTLNASDLTISGSGPAVDLSTGTVSVTINSLSSNGSGAEGIRLDNLAGTFTGSAGTLQNATNEDVDISGNNTSDTLDFTFAGTITDDVGTLVSVANQNGGTKLFSGAITDGDDGDGSGISLLNNTGATINFTGGVTLSTGGNAAFTATGGGTVNATQNNSSIVNKITTTTGTALNVASTNIGASNLTFRSIAVTGNNTNPSSGIILNTTGAAGGLKIVGNGSPCTPVTQTCTGGTITGTGSHGIFLTSTQHVVLNLMSVKNTGDHGIKGDGVNNFTLADSIIFNFGNASPVAGTPEDGIRFDNSAFPTTAGHGLTGTAIIQRVTIGPDGHFSLTPNPPSPPNSGLVVRNWADTNLTMTLTGTKFTQVSNDGVDVQIQKSTGTLNVDGTTADGTNTFDQLNGAGIRFKDSADDDANGILELTIKNNTFSNIGVGAEWIADGGTTLNARFNNNTMSLVKDDAVRPVASASGAFADPNIAIKRCEMNATIANNNMGGGTVFATAIRGCVSTMTFGSATAGQGNTNIGNITQTTYANYGRTTAFFHASAGARMNVDVLRNTLVMQGGAQIGALYFQVVDNGGGDGIICANAMNNVITGNPLNSIADIVIDNNDSLDGSKIHLEGWNGAGGNAGSTAFLAAQNTLNDSTKVTYANAANAGIGDCVTSVLAQNNLLNQKEFLTRTTSASQFTETAKVTTSAKGLAQLDKVSFARTNNQIPPQCEQGVVEPVALHSNNSEAVKIAKAQTSIQPKAKPSVDRTLSHHAKGKSTAPLTANAAKASVAMAPPPAPPTFPVIPTLPAGKSVTITFQVTLNAAMPFGTNQVTNQGTVSGSNFSDVLTDDQPGTAAADEPTITPIDAPTADQGNVSGQILDQQGNPVEGAAVRMTGTQNRLTITDAAGNYRFDNVETNGFYTVTPARANFMFGPTERSFSQLGNHTEAVFTGSYNGGTVNPLDTTEYFVRQQYVDFLSREPDEAGFKFWVNNIEVCGAEQSCRANKRTETSAAFFLSVEFQQTGYLVYKIYQSAYGDIAGAPVPLTRSEFKPDTETIGQGVIVQQAGWETVLENNKRAFTAAFVSRPRFTTAFPTTLSPTAFVNKLFTNAGFVPSDSERSAAISEFANAADTSNATARSKALRRVAESPTLNQQEFNQAFVLMQYFGYLRRSPNEAPEANLNYEGYTFWLTKLDHFNGNFQQAEMVKSFLVSGEYRQRFPK